MSDSPADFDNGSIIGCHSSLTSALEEMNSKIHTFILVTLLIGTVSCSTIEIPEEPTAPTKTEEKETLWRPTEDHQLKEDPDWFADMTEKDRRLRRACYQIMEHFNFTLMGPCTVEWVEENTHSLQRVSVESVNWQKFKEIMKNGDEIYYFETGGDTWENLMGYCGYILIRDVDAVVFHMTAMN